MVIRSGSANVTSLESLPKSPEISGPVSSIFLQSALPFILHVHEFPELYRSSLTPPSLTPPSLTLTPPSLTPPSLTPPSRTLTLPPRNPWRGFFTDSVGPPPDSSSECSPYVAPQTDLLPSFAKPTGQLTSRVDAVPLWPIPQRISHLERLPSTRFEILNKDWTAKLRRVHDLKAQLESLTSRCDRLLLSAKEHEPDGSGGFSNETTRTGSFLSSRNNDGNNPFSRNYRYRYTAALAESYRGCRLINIPNKPYPPVPLRGIADRSDSNSR
jgi:hypothetical protein